MKTIITIALLTSSLAFVASAQPDSGVEIDAGMASLDTVWQTVSEYHYDTTFGGVDWQEIHDRYYKTARTVRDDDSLIQLMNDMLLELKLSHYAVFRPEKKADGGSQLISAGSIGLGLRLFGEEAVISFLKPDFPAARAGLKPGYVITDINGVSVKQMLSDAAGSHIPHFSERRKISDMCDVIYGRSFGQPGDTVVIAYEDEAGTSLEATLLMQQRPGGTIIDEDFPTVYVDCNSARLADDIGYIYFSAVLPPADSFFLAAIEELSDVRGLIIDIRGNPGGMHTVGETIASKLIGEKTVFSVFKYRDSTVEVLVEPNPPVFEGPIAILIDVMNASASERFSGCMQSVGRATIIGEQSPGSVGPSNFKQLPNGATFMYLIAQSLTPDGTVLEGHGVVPDITVPLDRKALSRDEDTQIARAVEFLKSVRE